MIAGGVIMTLTLTVERRWAGRIMSTPATVLRLPIRAHGMAVFSTIYCALFFVGPAVAGAVADLQGDAGAAFWFAAGLMAVCTAALASTVGRCRLRPLQPETQSGARPDDSVLPHSARRPLTPAS
jgi:hypothetical protein